MSHNQAPAKPKKRIFTWVILVINALFLIWVIVGIASSSGNAKDCNGLDQATCNSATHAGTAIGVGLLIVFWAFVDIILGILWLVTRKKEPSIVYVQQAPSAPPAGAWHQAPNDPPGTQRWWDGSRWTEHTQQGTPPPA